MKAAGARAVQGTGALQHCRQAGVLVQSAQVGVACGCKIPVQVPGSCLPQHRFTGHSSNDLALLCGVERLVLSFDETEV